MKQLLLLVMACGASTPEPTTTPDPEPVTPTVDAQPAPRYSELQLGFDGACVIDQSTPVCWGEFMELFSEGAEPRRIDELSGARKLAIAGGMSACALMLDGELRCFGQYNESERLAANEAEVAQLEAQLNDDDEISDERADAIDREIAAIDQRLLPALVATDVRDVVVFDEGGCYLKDAVHCWNDADAQEGERPPEMTIGGDAEIVQLDSASTHRCFLQADGRVRCWGYGDGLGWIRDAGGEEEADQPGITPARDAVEIAVGEDFTCYRREAGSVACWGMIEDFVNVAHDPSGDYVPFEVPGVLGATRIVAGDDHACAIVAEGRVMCWGNNAFGALGTGTTDDVEDPVEVPALSPAREIAVGQGATCALVGEEVRCVGSNRYSVFGNIPPEEPRLFPARGTRLLTPGYRTCVEINGELSCTGGVIASLNRNLRLRPFDDDDRVITQLDGYISYECVLRGSDATCGRLSRASSASTTDQRVLPDVSAISVGTTSSCVLQRGQAHCWRNRADRQTHTDLLTRHVDPTRIPGVDRAESIDVGDVHACVVRTDGRVLCWGDNTRGLVRAPAGEINVPAVLEGVTNAAQVSLNRTSTCVRKRDKTLVCRTTTDDWRPVEIADVVDVVARGYQRFVLTGDHQVYRVNVGGVELVELPAEVVELSAGTAHVCARARDGRVWCWGIGENGELGVLPSWIHLEPVVISLDL